MSIYFNTLRPALRYHRPTRGVTRKTKQNIRSIAQTSTHPQPILIDQSWAMHVVLSYLDQNISSRRISYSVKRLLESKSVNSFIPAKTIIRSVSGRCISLLIDHHSPEAMSHVDNGYSLGIVCRRKEKTCFNQLEQPDFYQISIEVSTQSNS